MDELEAAGFTALGGPDDNDKRANFTTELQQDPSVGAVVCGVDPGLSYYKVGAAGRQACAGAMALPRARMSAGTAARRPRAHQAAGKRRGGAAPTPQTDTRGCIRLQPCLRLCLPLCVRACRSSMPRSASCTTQDVCSSPPTQTREATSRPTRRVRGLARPSAPSKVWLHISAAAVCSRSSRCAYAHLPGAMLVGRPLPGAAAQQHNMCAAPRAAAACCV